MRPIPDVNPTNVKWLHDVNWRAEKHRRNTETLKHHDDWQPLTGPEVAWPPASVVNRTKTGSSPTIVVTPVFA